MKLLFPTEIACRDGYCPKITSVNQAARFLSQPFGVNWAPFSYKEVFGVEAHDGVDIAIPVGTRVRASHDGKVIEVDNRDDTDGLGVSLYDPIQKIITIYWHNSENLVKLGDEVKRGQTIALSGGTGKSYGFHVHWGCYLTDDSGKIINMDNGYRGAIDPMPYLTWSTNMLTENDVKQFYILAFNRLPDEGELTYWTGKPFSSILATALKDRAEFLNQQL